MQVELKALEENNTWELVDLPKGSSEEDIVAVKSFLHDKFTIKDLDIAKYFLEDPSTYRRLIGRLLYLDFTRPDLTHVVHHLNEFMQHPTRSAKLKLQAYCDADWAKCKLTRRTITTYCVILDSSLIFCKSKKLNTVSMSSAEAEYRSLAFVVCELKWLSYMFAYLHVTLSKPISLWCDNNSAIHMTVNPMF
ncbi:transmembrane signal receptor [Lithospermum erythrorhizon]|uniref:Transmembrane signal receptor n=1 Tax=Lithospermum erythrorhizon TaxID=34254 RepID=A0AAV3PGY0_LITER